MRFGVFRLLVVSAGLIILTGCTFYVGGSNAGTREGKKAALLPAPAPAPTARHNT